MKRQTKKLAIHSETLRLLDRKALTGVRGAVTQISCGGPSYCAECSAQPDCSTAC